MIVVDSSLAATVADTVSDDCQVIIVNDATTASNEFVEAMSKTFGITAIQADENFQEIARAFASLSRYFVEQSPGFLSDHSPDKSKADPAPTRDRRGHASDRRRRWSRWIYGLG